MYVYRYEDIENLWQWEFQDPKMEVLYHIRPYFVPEMTIDRGKDWDSQSYNAFCVNIVLSPQVQPESQPRRGHFCRGFRRV
jgi:hypothetical protein